MATNKEKDILQEPRLYGVESRGGEFLILKDHSGIESVGSCACTLTGTTIDEFRKFIERPAPWYDADFFNYVSQWGWFALVGLAWIDGGKLGGLETLRMSKARELRGNYAYLVVQGRKTGKPTSVLWDGYEVLDPDPEAETKGVELRQYTILELYFLDRWVGPRIGEVARV